MSGPPKSGTGGAPGAPLFEYRPARFGPMTVALLFILAIATPLAAMDRALAGRPDQVLQALIPLCLVLFFGWLTTPSPLRIARDWIEVSLSRAARMRGATARYPLSAVSSIYPTFYEDAGMRFSPFASAEGTAKHAGIRLEIEGGKHFVVPFTPTVLNLRRHGTPPYHAAVVALEQACAGAGRPMVKDPPGLSAKQVDAMLVESSKPLLPFPVTVAGIFAPALIIPSLAAVWSATLGPVPPVGTALVVLVGLVPLAAVFLLVNLRSGKRTELLHQVQKHRQSERERNPGSSREGAPEGDAPKRPAAEAPARVLKRRAR